MKIQPEDLGVLPQTAYAGIVTLGFSHLIGFATQQDALLIAALPLGLLLVGLLFWLQPRAQLLSWATVTAWLLSSVYLGSPDLEYLESFLTTNTTCHWHA